MTLSGLIDGHTHPVWAGDRVHEFAMKLAGRLWAGMARDERPAPELRTH